MSIERLLEEIKTEVDNALEQRCNTNDLDDSGKSLEMLRYATSGGKRIRSAVLLWSNEAVGGDPQKIINAAAAIELMHAYSLIHDDIIDKDQYRRGTQAIHSKWGIEQAILVGDYLANEAFLLLGTHAKKGFTSTQIIHSLNALALANKEMVKGQYLDVLLEKQLDITEDQYIDIAQRKTGALFRASASIGYFFGNSNMGQLNALEEYADNVGIAFQIRDDILDLVGSQNSVAKRKPIGSDIRQGKQTLILSHFLRHANADGRKKLTHVFGKRVGTLRQDAIMEVIMSISRTDSIAYAQDYAKVLIRAAKNSLDTLTETPAKKALIELADYIVERDY